jgi:hypothetical protein
LWTLADTFSDSFESFLTAAGLALYIYSIIDACRSARRANLGIDLQEEDDQIRLWLRDNINLAGIGLILIGSLTIINTLFPSLLNRFWPILFLLSGIYLLNVRPKRGSIEHRNQ